MRKKILTILLVFVMVFASSLTCFASGFNAPDGALSSTNDSYIIVDVGGVPTCIVYNSSDWTPKITHANVSSSSSYNVYYLKWTKNRETAYVRYSSNTYSSSSSNGGWGTMSQFDSLSTEIARTSGSYSVDFTNMKYVKIYAASRDIYTSQGALVFQGTPPLTLEKATEMSLEEMTQEVGGVMKTIALCGVGCLALLIGLNLLRRKSVIFLNR